MDIDTAGQAYDFNCPQFVDFSEPIPLDDGADKWFELDHEDFEEEGSQLNNDSRHELEDKAKTPRTPKSKPSTPQVATPTARIAPIRQEGSSGPVTRQQSKMIPDVEMAPTHLYTSLDEWRAKKSQPAQASDSEKKVGRVAPFRSGKRLASTGERSPCPVESKKPALKRQKLSSGSLRRSGPTDTSDTRSRSLRRSNSSTSHQAERIVRPHSRGYSANRSGSLNGRKKEETETPKLRLPTMPTTPTFMKRKVHTAGSPKKKTTEEQELEQIAHMRKELAKKRKMAADSLKKSRAASNVSTVHSEKELTRPMDFKFSTDSRVKPHEVHDDTCEDFARSLRSKTNAVTQAPQGLTRPQPFKLSGSHKAPPTQLEKYQSMAQSIAAFHRSTPDRFRTKPRMTGADRKLLKARSPRNALTHPETPKLQTRTRSRPTHVVSQRELEEQELEEIKKHQFKAHPVNSKIMSQTTGLHKPEPKPNTEPAEFNLHLERRIKDRQALRQDEDEEYVFHAQPINKKILEGPVGVKPGKSIPPTIPQSPAFALKHRVRLPVELPEEKEAEKSLPKIQACPYNGVPFQPKLSHRITTPTPFSFEQRYRDPNSVKEQLRRQVLEEEQRAREFKANPLPSLEPVLPERHTKICTKPEPFNLMSDMRGEKKSEDWNHKVVEEEAIQKKKAAVFKARPAEVLRQEPFMPARSNRPLTDVSEVVLNTEKRAVDRDDYELRKKAREAQLAEMVHEREVQKQEEEKAAVAKLRQEMVHKSNPVRKFKPVLIHGSDKSPTCPESPQFSDRNRRKVRM